MEYERIEPVEKTKTESGYSEKEQAKIVEGKTKDISVIRKRQADGQQTDSQKEKILKGYHELSGRVNALVEEYYNLETQNHRQAENLLEEIKTLREIQEELLHCMVLASKGQLNKESVSQEVWDLIE
ncbi:MAG: hypothetical protein ACREGI_00545 [Candidatus Levyibacteriota bacterium]